MPNKDLDELDNESLIAEENNLLMLEPDELDNLSDEELLAEETALLAHAPEPISEFESAARGIAQGATAGFADEISGAIESAITDKPYEQARKESRENFSAAQVANPNAYIIGEVAGGIGTTVATGGASAGYRGAAIIGGLSGIGFSNRTGSDLLKDAAIGTAFGIGGESVAKGIGRFVQKAFKKSSPITRKVFEDIGETTRPENVKFEANIIRDAFNGRLGSADDWVMSDTFGRQVQKGLDDTPKLMKSIFRDKFKQLGGQIEAIVDDLPTKSVDISDTVDNFKKTLNETLKKSGPDKGAMKTITREILDGLDDGTFGVRLSEVGKGLDINDMTPSQVIEFKRSIQEIVFAKTDSDGITNLIKDSKRATTLLSDFVNEITDRANNLDASGRLKEVNRQYSQLIQADALVPDKNKSHILLKLQDAVGANAQAGDMRNLNQLLEGVDPEFRAMFIKEINPRLSAFRLHQSAKFQGGEIGTLFRAKAGAAAGAGVGLALGGPTGAIIGGGAGFVAGAGEAAMVNVANALGKARKAFKVPRSVNGIFNNSDIIVSKLSQVSPAFAITLNDLVAEGDRNGVEEFIKQLMQQPQSQGQFEDGIGFEGKAVTPQEHAQVRQGIMSSSIPLSQKIQAVNDLAANGTIPLPENMQAPEQGPTMQTIKRKENMDNMNKVKLIEKGLE